MSFSRAKSTGWTAGIDKITAAQINQIDVNQSRAVDGTGGGVYQPSAAIEIQGTAGLKVDGSGSAARLQYGSRSLTRTQTSLLWNNVTNAFGVGGVNVDTGESSIQTIDRVPNGATITGFTLYHDRVDALALPTTRVKVRLRKKSSVTGTTTTITGPTEDPESNLANYNAHHAITITGLSEVVDNTTTTYWVQVDGEAGGTTAVTAVMPCLVTYTVTNQDEAP